MIKPMDLEYISIRVAGMKAHGLRTSKMEKEKKTILMGPLMMVFTEMD